MPALAPKSYVMQYPALKPSLAAGYFGARLSCETDPSDLAEDLKAKLPGLLVLDPRKPASYRKGHIPGALSLWHWEIDAKSAAKLPKDKTIVVYGSYAACNAGTKAAFKLSKLGFKVKEMLGGFEAWLANGYKAEKGGPASK